MCVCECVWHACVFKSILHVVKVTSVVRLSNLDVAAGCNRRELFSVHV